MPIRPQPAHKPTKATRLAVKSMSAFGIDQDLIAGQLGITGKTLRKYYPNEIKFGGVELVSKVAQRLFTKASSKKMDHAGVVAAIFILKARGGWRDDYRKVELSNADGSPIKGSTTNNILILPDNRRDPALMPRPAPPMKLIESKPSKVIEGVIVKETKEAQ